MSSALMRISLPSGRHLLGPRALGEDHAQLLLAVREFVLAHRLDAKDGLSSQLDDAFRNQMAGLKIT